MEDVQASQKELAADWESTMGPISLNDNVPIDSEGKPSWPMILLLRASLHGGDAKTQAELTKQFQNKFEYYGKMEEAEVAVSSATRSNELGWQFQTVFFTTLTLFPVSGANWTRAL